jgi:prevent-host-death family protein
MAAPRPRKVVTAADANRNFSELLREVRKGRSVTITVHGTPVAKLAPLDDRDSAVDEARRTLLARLRRQRAVKAVAWTRESLYGE